ncbi:MAG: hypothetical protein EXR68_07890 [Dehalococcoidia bacterium]|nr:hypothetical protein [Dehalococcoidia bacterium]
MQLRDFRTVGNWRVLLGVMGTFIAENLVLGATEKGSIAALPALAGSAFRLVFGPLSDHIGSRRAGLIGLTLAMVPFLQGYKSVKWVSAVHAYRRDPVGIKRMLGQSKTGRLG